MKLLEEDEVLLLLLLPWFLSCFLGTSFSVLSALRARIRRKFVCLLLCRTRACIPVPTWRPCRRRWTATSEAIPPRLPGPRSPTQVKPLLLSLWKAPLFLNFFWTAWAHGCEALYPMIDSVRIPYICSGDLHATRRRGKQFPCKISLGNCTRRYRGPSIPHWIFIVYCHSNASIQKKELNREQGVYNSTYIGIGWVNVDDTVRGSVASCTLGSDCVQPVDEMAAAVAFLFSLT